MLTAGNISTVAVNNLSKTGEAVSTMMISQKYYRKRAEHFNEAPSNTLGILDTLPSHEPSVGRNWNPEIFGTYESWRKDVISTLNPEPTNNIINMYVQIAGNKITASTDDMNTIANINVNKGSLGYA